MALPANISTGHVHGHFVDLTTGVPAHGYVLFEPRPTRLADTSVKLTLIPAKFKAVLSASGEININLPATDDPDLQPSGFTYEVTEKFRGGAPPYSIAVPAGTTVELSDVLEVDPRTGVANIKGDKGDKGDASTVAGPAGPGWLAGHGVPSAGLGSNGEFYLDLDAVAFYGPKTSGAWGTATGLKGTDGADGAATLNAALDAINALTPADDKFPVYSGPSSAELKTITPLAQDLLAGVDTDAMQTTLGFSTFFKTLVDDGNTAAFLTTLGIPAFVQTILDDTDAPTALNTIGAAPTTAIKASVRCVAVTNGTLATAYENGDTVDGITLATGDRILLAAQTTGADNGIYTVNASGAPTRALDFDATAELLGGLTVQVRQGTGFAGREFKLTNTGTITVGTTAQTWAIVPTGQSAGYVQSTAGKSSTNTGAVTADKISGVAQTIIGTGREVEIRWGATQIRNSVANNWMWLGLIVNSVADEPLLVTSPSTSVGVTANGYTRMVLTAGTSYTFEVGITSAGGTTVMTGSPSKIWLWISEQ